MTRGRNRRRRVPLHPATSGTFQPLKDPNKNPIDEGDQKSDVAEFHHSPHAASTGDRRTEEPQIDQKNENGNGRRSLPHSDSTCVHSHRCHHHHQKWEEKEINDLRKNLIQKHLGVEGNSRPQEYTPYMAARAKELKEEGNRLFQKKEYSSAMDQYDLALKVTPPAYPDRAIFHSNRAACLMQMKPVQYDAAIHECNLALEAHPGFPRALLRRARAFEAVGKLELALRDAELFLQGEVSHPDAIDMARRIREMLENGGDEAQQDDQVMSAPQPVASFHVNASREACVNPIADSGSHPSATRSISVQDLTECNEDDHGAIMTPCAPTWKMQFQAPPCSPSEEISTEVQESLAQADALFDGSKAESLKTVIHQDNIQTLQNDNMDTSQMRPLKLIYDHDIRLGEMPVNCTFADLRRLVKSRFPSSKSILIKYKDAEGDLVTITSTRDLRLAEAAAAIEAASRSLRMASMSEQGVMLQNALKDSTIGLPVVPSALDQLRLHVVEVPAEQEPYDKEGEAVMEGEGSSITGDRLQTLDRKDSNEEVTVEQPKHKADYDKWLVDFAQLVRTHLGIDPVGHTDLQERGMELCAEALEEAISTEEAHKLLELAAGKFQEMTALGFLNWGNVFMCTARKQLPHEDDDSQLDFCDKLQAAFEWAQAQYTSAEEKFEQSIHTKPDYYDAMLSLSQKDFESAKLHWSLAIAKQTDLSTWDPSMMLELFRKAEKRMQAASELLDKQESLTKDAMASRDADENLQGGGAHQKTLTLEQDVALKSQIYLFWGNILYEHSQVEFRLGLPLWKQLLDAAVHKFEVGGASSVDIETALEKHLSSSAIFLDAMESMGNQQGSGSEVQDTIQDANGNRQVEADSNEETHDNEEELSIDDGDTHLEADHQEVIQDANGNRQVEADSNKETHDKEEEVSIDDGDAHLEADHQEVIQNKENIGVDEVNANVSAGDEHNGVCVMLRVANVDNGGMEEKTQNGFNK